MNRRDLLKLIGIGGVGAVATAVGGKEAEAAPVAEAKPVMVQGAPQLPGWEWIGSSRVLNDLNYYPMGTATLYHDFGYLNLSRAESRELDRLHELGYQYQSWSPSSTMGTGLPSEELRRAREWAIKQGFNVGGGE